jgi:hypothetical protein
MREISNLLSVPLSITNAWKTICIGQQCL